MTQNRNTELDLDRLSEEEILSLRICELSVGISGTWLEKCVSQLHQEMEQKGLLLRPSCYLADEWLTPDGEPVIGIPFYLAHPALIRLEKKMMLEAEGGTKDWCMKLLRHEAGHAVNYAYKLHKRRKWHKIFGPFSREYAETYRFRPFSRSFVRHLEDYYAQYHPDEDFSETFAVWLTPEHDWKKQYSGWKALQKLEYVDELMRDISHKAPLVQKGKKYWPASRLRSTLKNYYKRKKRFHAEDLPDFHDMNLKAIFHEKTEKGQCYAHEIIRRHRKNLIFSVSNWTGEKKYIIDDLLKKISKRCRELHLVVSDSEEDALLKISVYTTTLMMNYLYTGRLRGQK